MKEKVYFGVEHKEKFYLPDTNKEQWIEVRVLNASQRAAYLNSLGELSQTTPEGKITVDATHAADWELKLLEAAVAGYKVKVMENGETKTVEGSDPNEWSNLYAMMNASITERLMNKVRELNPWLLPTESADEKKN